MKKRILVPTDFSTSADMALKYALNFGKYIGADEIHLLHAIQIPINPADTIVPTSQIMVDDSEKLLNELKQKVSSWPESMGFTILTHSVVEDVVTAVRNYSRDTEPQYVVMGTRGASGVEEFLFGTTAADVLENSDVPVLVVPAFNTFKKPGHIAFAADLANIANMEALAPLKNLAVGFNARIVILHVGQELELTEAEKKAKQELKDYFQGLDMEFEVIHSENIYTGIEGYIQDQVPDMVAVLTRKYKFFEKIFHTSVSKKIAHRTLIPLLSLRENS